MLAQELKVMLNSFAQKYGVEEILPVNQYTGTINISGFIVHVGICDMRKLILFQSAVGVIPEKNPLELFKMLLSANNLFAETSGATLGIDTKESLVTLQVAWPFEHLTYSKLETLIENVLLLIGEWIENIYHFLQKPINTTDTSIEEYTKASTTMLEV